jgi:hypothetical protein
MASLYDLGEGVFVRSSFTDPTTGVAADPSTVTAKILPPSYPAGTPITYVYGTDPEVEKDAVGEYHVLLTADEVGLWQYRWEGENTAPGIQEGSFVVRRTELA